MFGNQYADLRTRCCLTALIAVLSGACSTPTQPSNSRPPVPLITCPAPQTAQSPDGGPTAVNYPAPTSSGGAPPVTVECNRGSGSMFIVGTTTVTCTATDALQRTDSCSFTVTVAPPPPRISATRFVAFGNSLTEGGLGTGAIATSPYPAVLERLLASRYTAQTLAVLNRGRGGERVAEGLARLPDVLSADRPDALLLMEGVNDLAAGAKISTVVDTLRDMTKIAQARGVQVFLGTLPPERAGGSRGRTQPLVQPTNDQIRRAAMLQGATLVDVYEGLGGTPDPWIGDDGLHPNEMGYARIAEIFYTAVRLQFEAKASGGYNPTVWR